MGRHKRRIQEMEKEDEERERRRKQAEQAERMRKNEEAEKENRRWEVTKESLQTREHGWRGTTRRDNNAQQVEFQASTTKRKEEDVSSPERLWENGPTEFEDLQSNHEDKREHQTLQNSDSEGSEKFTFDSTPSGAE